MLEIQTQFLKMQKGMTFDEKFLLKNGLDGFIQLPMSVESFKIPKPLTTLIKKTIDGFKGIKTTAEQDQRKYIEEIIDEINKNSEILNQFVDIELILAKFFEQLSSEKSSEETLTPTTPRKKGKTK